MDLLKPSIWEGFRDVIEAVPVLELLYQFVQQAIVLEVRVRKVNAVLLLIIKYVMKTRSGSMS
jgi:hypothetical protein